MKRKRERGDNTLEEEQQMTQEELMQTACLKAGCKESMFCFGGRTVFLCQEAISQCRILRERELHQEVLRHTLSKKTKEEKEAKAKGGIA